MNKIILKCPKCKKKLDWFANKKNEKFLVCIKCHRIYENPEYVEWEEKK